MGLRELRIKLLNKFGAPYLMNLGISEHGLDCKNASSVVYMPQDHDRTKRKPMPLVGAIFGTCR